MVSLDLLFKILCWHLIPSMTTVFLTTGFVILVARVFNVKSPRWLYWLYSIPLAKGLVILINGARSWPDTVTDKPFILIIRLWDPLRMISIPSASDTFAEVSVAAEQMIIAGIILLISILISRWIFLFVFYKSLGGEELCHDDAPRLFRVLDALVGKMHTTYPKVKVSDKPYILPCLVGLHNPTIILSPEIVEESSEDILEAILAHELAHLKRHDNLLHWISVMLRDLLVLNPFAHLVFPRILSAKEQDCDRIAADATRKPKIIAQAIVYTASATNQKKTKPLPGNLSEVTEFMSIPKLTNRRIDMLLSNTSAKKQEMPRVKGLALVFFALITFFMHFCIAWPALSISPILMF